MNNKIKFHSFLLFIVLALSSCKTKNKNVVKDEWNTGSIAIAADENLKEVVEQLALIYEHEYSEAKINFNFEPQDKIISDFLNGKITSMIVNRNLTKEEIELGTQNQQTKVVENILAYNAIALIANKTYKDSVIDLSNIKNYLEQNATTKLVFDNTKSGIAKFILEKEKLDISLFKNALVVNNANEVIDFVTRNNTSIGFIPFNYISNTHSIKAKDILSKIKTLAIIDSNKTYSLSQQSLYDFQYPLYQSITVVLGKNPETVGTAFVNWLVKERAAKVLLKSGLIPYYMPIRNINVKDELEIN